MCGVPQGWASRDGGSRAAAAKPGRFRNRRAKKLTGYGRYGMYDQWERRVGGLCR